MKQDIKKVNQWWKRVKTTSRFHNLLLYFVFVVIATIFWFVLALNDSVQGTFEVRLNISGVPDSVTFINEAPAQFHVTVRDKGTGLLRNAFLHKPKLNINFREYASPQTMVLRVPKADLLALLRNEFGPSAQIASLSLDSLKLAYTDRPGKRVPISASIDVTASPGYVVGSRPKLSQGFTLIYGPAEITDTVRRIFTEKIVMRNLSESKTVATGLAKIPGTRIIPDRIKVTVPIEPLVNKHSIVSVSVINANEGESVLLFPQKVEVSYYVPMSRFNDEDSGFDIVADYSARGKGISGRIPVRLVRAPKEYVNVSLLSDSLEYTVVK